MVRGPQVVYSNPPSPIPAWIRNAAKRLRDGPPDKYDLAYKASEAAGQDPDQFRFAPLPPTVGGYRRTDPAPQRRPPPMPLVPQQEYVQPPGMNTYPGYGTLLHRPADGDLPQPRRPRWARQARPAPPATGRTQPHAGTAQPQPWASSAGPQQRTAAPGTQPYPYAANPRTQHPPAGRSPAGTFGSQGRTTYDPRHAQGQPAARPGTRPAAPAENVENEYWWEG